MRSILGRPPGQDSTHASVSPSEVNARDVGDGDGFTAYVDTADRREATDVPQEVHEALSARDHTRRHKNYQIIDDAEYKVVNGSNNQEMLARKYRIRMRGIDAPKLKMEYGMESRNELVNLIDGKRVMIHVYEMDQYERCIGDIYCDGVFIQEQMLKRGFAWYCKIYDKRCEFGQWEGEARAARQGLWLSDNPEKPWEWKRDHPRNARKQDCLEKRPQKTQPILEAQMDNGSCDALSRMIKEEKNAEEKAREWEKELESVVAENRMLNDLLRESKEALQNEKEACNAEEKEARQWKKELESALAEKRMLNELLRKSKEALQNEKEACNAEGGKARQWKRELESVVDENHMLKYLLWESEEKARLWKEELESVEAENRMLKSIKQKAIWVAVGIALLCSVWKTPPKKTPRKKDGVAQLCHYVRTRIW